jgi:hypothetical protein
MSLPEIPQQAENIITFSDSEFGPAVIRYDVPMPGSHTGKRIVQLDLGLTPSDFIERPASGTGTPVPTPLAALRWTKSGDNSWTYEPVAALEYFFNVLRDVGFPEQSPGLTVLQTKLAAGELTGADNLLVSTALDDVRGPLLDVLTPLYSRYVLGLRQGRLVQPVKKGNRQFDSEVTSAEVALGLPQPGSDKKAGPEILLIETYGAHDTYLHLVTR